MNKGEIPKPTPNEESISRDFLTSKGAVPRFIPYDVASGYPETPRDIAGREEKIGQIRQGKY